jgi:superfamily I DNA/RNA helicase
VLDYTEVFPIYGPPGTGKTTTCVALVSDLIEKGVDPQQIAYVAFTKKAAYEAVDRVATKLGVTKNSLKYFTTIHAMANRAYKAEHPDTRQLMKPSDFEAIGERLSMPVRAHWSITEDADFVGSGAAQYGSGDFAMSQINLSRARGIALDDQLANYAKPEDFLRSDCMPQEIIRFHTYLEKYKHTEGKYDFNDMLERTSTCAPLPVRYAIIDEAQDLSAAQWTVCHNLLRDCRQVWVAGDDDQAIYSFSGADAHTFLSMGSNPNARVLERTWRLPKAIYDYAAKLIEPVKQRVPKEWHTEKEEGMVDSLPLLNLPIEEGDWLLLVRNRQHMRTFEELLRVKGFGYRLDGRASVAPATVEAIKAWEMVRTGKPITVDAAYRMYSKLPVGKALQHGVKSTVKTLLKEEGVTEQVTWDDLPGMKANRERAWFEVLQLGSPQAMNYYRQVARHGELFKEPRIRVNTIHGVKGGEADNVAILPSMGRMTWDNAFNNFRPDGGTLDDEHRCAYVAATRAKQNLYIINDPTDLQFPYHQYL